MFGPLGVPELLFIFGLALLIFGPRKLPEIGRTLGKGMAEFRKASNELKRTINAEMIQEELQESDPRRALKDALATDPKPGSPNKKSAASSSETPSQAAASATDGKPADSSLSPSGEPGSVARGQLDQAASEVVASPEREAGEGDLEVSDPAGPDSGS